MKSYLIRKGINDLLPICMRTKWQSYFWTLNRLVNPYDKMIFLLKAHEDTIIDFYEGNLLRFYWDDVSWNIVFNIISSFEKNIVDIGGSFDVQSIVDMIIKNGLDGKIQCVDSSFLCKMPKSDLLYIIDSKENLYEKIVEKFISEKKMNFLVL